MSFHSHPLLLRSPQETADFAKRLAPILRAGDTLLLHGDIGSGKTLFARNIISSLIQSAEDIPSPTFTLVQTYDGQDSEIWHVDLYRISDPSEIFELGLIDAFPTSICLVEWPERFLEFTPYQALSLRFALCEEAEHRSLSIDTKDKRWATRLKGLADG